MKKLLTLLFVCSLLLTQTYAAVRPHTPSDIKTEPAVSADTAAVKGRESEAVLYLTNEERLARGLEPLCSTAVLQTAAVVRASELRSSFSHTRPDGRAFHTVLADFSIQRRQAAENIAVGQSDAMAVVNAWMNSPSHRQAILNADYRHLGVGYIPGYGSDTYRSHWSQEFVADRCTLSDLCILDADGSAVTEISLPAGKKLSDAGLTLSLACSIHGTCTLPLSDRLCSGYNASRTQAQQAKISVYGLNASLTVLRGALPPPKQGSLTNFKPKFEELPRYRDVLDTDWFSDVVYEAGFLGLMNGTGAAAFQPASSLRVSEVLTLAARIHSIYYGGDGVFTGSGANWYRAAVDYCIANGIAAEADLPADMSRAATRAETARWLAASISPDALAPISKRIPADMVPDSADAKAVYLLYAAGVLTGDAAGAYHPLQPLKRSEAAAIVVRLVQTYMRVM